MLNFCLRSIFREYGWQFVCRVAARHPVRTAKALLRACRNETCCDAIAALGEGYGGNLGGRGAIVGVGFCLKPLSPPCPSGRSNHDCHYLERLLLSGCLETPDCCRQCAIRQIGIDALRAGAAFYIMTSAKDILLDVFMPALRDGRFSSGLFALCKYSFRPFAVGMLASGIRGPLIAFERGDCADYTTWLQADRGVKEDQTAISEQNWKRIRDFLAGSNRGTAPIEGYTRQGNLFCPGRESSRLRAEGEIRSKEKVLCPL